MKSGIVISGVILAIIGVMVFLLSLITVPYTTTRLEEVPHSSVWLNESFSVPALSHIAYYGTFYETLHITFTVTAGGNRDIDFRVMDEVNYWKMRAGESYEYYTVPSRSRISSLDIEWTPPSGKKIYFVWDNSFSLLTSKSVSAYFSFTWTELESREVTEYRTLLPSEASYLGVLFLIGGLVIAGYGIAYKPPSPVMPEAGSIVKASIQYLNH